MRNIRKRRIIILILAGLTIVLAIGIYSVVPTGVASMEIVNGKGERLGEELELFTGSELQIECRVYPEIFADRKTRYSSANENIVYVDETGLVKGLKIGEAVVTVQHAGIQQSINVKVQPSIKAIKGLPNEVTLYEGDGYLLEPEVIMAEKEMEAPDVMFKSKRTSVAEVDAEGQIIAGESGTTTITVTAGTVSVKIPITVITRP